MKSPFLALFVFCAFTAILVTGLFAAKGINPFEMNLNVFHLQPLAPVKPVVPTPNLQSQITLTNKDVQNVITASASDYLSNPTVSIGKTDISASADVKKIVKTHADITLAITFKDGKVIADITDLKTGTLGAPTALKTTVTNLINNRLDAEINNRYKITGFSQETGKIIVTVKS